MIGSMLLVRFLVLWGVNALALIVVDWMFDGVTIGRSRIAVARLDVTYAGAPAQLQEAIDRKYYDELVPVAGAEGIKWARELARREGIFTGISGGSTFAVARKIAEAAPAGAVVLAMLPDTGERYMTTPLFEGIKDDMDEDETAISMSTPGFQMPPAPQA